MRVGQRVAVSPGAIARFLDHFERTYSRLGNLPPKAGNILEAILYRGELPRGEVAGLLGTTARHARRIVAALADHRVLTSDGPRASLRLAFPAALAPRWMPGLFPERAR